MGSPYLFRTWLATLGVVCGCRADPVYVDRSALPEDVDWVAVFLEDANGRRLESFGLRSLAEGSLVLEAEDLAKADELVLITYRSRELEGLVRDFSEATMASPLRVPTPTEPAFPVSQAQFSLRLPDGISRPEGRWKPITSGALLPCPPLGREGAPGVFQISCADAPCLPSVTQLNCRLELDFRSECGAEVLDGRLDARGSLTREYEDVWYGHCTSTAPRKGTYFELECTHPDGPRCFAEGAPMAEHAPLEWDSARLLPEAPEAVAAPAPLLMDGLWPLGTDELVTFTPGRELCQSAAVRRLLYVSRSTLALTRTATMADCLVTLSPMPGDDGFWGIATNPYSILRVGADGRVRARRSFELDAVSASGLPFSFVYDEGLRILLGVFAEQDRSSRTLVEFVVFDPETLEVLRRRVFDESPRMEKVTFAWGSLVALDDDLDQLRFLDPVSFESTRTLQLSALNDHRSYASVSHSPALDRLLIRVSGRFRAVLLVDAALEMTRIFNFETTIHPYAQAPLTHGDTTELVVGFGEPAEGARGFLGLIDVERGRFWPGLSRFEGDYPDVLYADEGEEAAYALLRSTAQILKIRRRPP